MRHQYNIEGLTCTNCVAKAKSALLKLGDVAEADVQLSAPQATITMEKHIPTSTLQAALLKEGNFIISEADSGIHHHYIQSNGDKTGESSSWLITYKPILLIGAYVLGSTLLTEATNGLSLHRWMQNFMATFFLVFSFFKLLDIKGFAESYASYDIVAKRWQGWGMIYPFVELALGVAYLTRFSPLLTNSVTFVVMSVSLVGVLQSVLNKRKIRCACLGVVFNLPMSTITIIEDGLMIVMSLLMVLSLNNMHL